ncbi:hypothetical protein A2574_01955 [Candidatus Shapirobacteria bacterium RIFOXYD1_FULL_38_32]|uniref:Uncharacterized protein n=2 Tax=Candidatus Shapironibacteriota TaxID=1752721 RepID=A0A0G0JPK8_9BACT|nr:MAG: hypothetical protein US90_C0016G0010 [Candidatus Shapirobacteria bacterium GW2011_GWE2_38_30]OGL55935.1 MAG: hypothetical protein A2195_02165 [Candidatus Shapirobacteria bacterium RIFOXYA1_FULL_39_17]OGL55978.1 MAG: hypothetical protein A2367_00030 [Candidatus Shapirobacteria bacterium RIFOXYB1_FULL_38_38]OGL57561.1 MAG: hypothetical protein A2410_02040 [Candidatus Shapirobacteria bacterium RIFOXYC1_FULL_38_24]OGL57858.1 MAG: hypothetical protein A2574_01955 [Candidatus Shapirobacteria 
MSHPFDNPNNLSEYLFALKQADFKLTLLPCIKRLNDTCTSLKPVSVESCLNCRPVTQSQDLIRRHAGYQALVNAPPGSLNLEK